MTYNSFVFTLVVCVAVAIPSVPSETNTRSREADEFYSVPMSKFSEKPDDLDNANDNLSRDSIIRTKRIVGGHTANIKDFPYMVGLNLSNMDCGGSIIHERFVLTAKHCVENNLDFIRAGSSYWSNGGTIHHKKRIILNSEGDIAIVEVEEPFVWNENTSKIELFNHNEAVNPDTFANVSGWGRTLESDAESSSEILQYIEVPIYNRELCHSNYSQHGISIKPNRICAGYFFNYDKGVCHGDSGGPLVINGRQAGVVSGGGGCHTYPEVFESIPYFREWIRTSIGI